MAHRVYIDGHVGTVGLRIRDWLADRDDLELVTLPDADRKSAEARRACVAESDIAVLCLPDEAAREAAGWAAESGTRVLDASTAHRVDHRFVYGLPELTPDQRGRIADADRVSNPGCYPSAYLLLVRPLADLGLLPSDAPLSIHALSGYSGGGRPMIERWEDAATGLPDLGFEAPYALDKVHKHIPEMQSYSGLEHAPQFVPAVGPFRSGMRVQVPVHAAQLATGTTGKQLWEALEARYRDEPFVRVHPIADPLDSHERTFDPTVCNDTNRIELRVLPHPSGHCLLMGILDNLGKGASGVAIQCLNTMLGLEETTGLPT